MMKRNLARSPSLMTMAFHFCSIDNSKSQGICCACNIFHNIDLILLPPACPPVSVFTYRGTIVCEQISRHLRILLRHGVRLGAKLQRTSGKTADVLEGEEGNTHTLDGKPYVVIPVVFYLK